jgi:tetratricopeptide (TPR) repeat protein
MAMSDARCPPPNNPMFGRLNRKMRRAETRNGGRHRQTPASGRKYRSTSNSDALTARFAEALHCQQSGRLAEAVVRYDRLLSVNPNLAEVHGNRGAALAGLGKFADAEAAYRRAIALNPDFVDAHNNLGIALCELGRWDGAESAFRVAIALKPDWPQSHSNLGIALKCRGSFVEAEAAHHKAIALDPDSPALYGNLADVLTCLGKLNDAEQTLRHAIALQPRFADAFAKLGNTLREQGRMVEAEAACRDALALDPGHAEAWSNLGNALTDQGRLIEAEAAYRRAIALKPNFGDAHNNLSAVLKQLGRMEEASQAMQRALRLPPRDALRYLNLSEIRQFTAGDPYLADMEEFAGGIASLPTKQQIQLHFALAKAYDDVGRHADSFQQLSIGNALKRQQIPYDEAATLALLEAIRTAFTPELIHTFRNAGEPSPVPVFVVGMPRSGTTLIEQILASHPTIFGAGELPNFCQAGTDILSAAGCPLPVPDASLSGAGDHLRQIGERYVAEIAALAPTAARIVNKMPSNFLFAGLIHLALPNARIIHAVRDPADTCMSCFSKLFANGQSFTYDLAELGRYYRHYDALMQHWHLVLPPGRILDVRYEDLVTDFEPQARRIVDHCGLHWDRRCLDFHGTERPVRTASATQVRQPIYCSAVGRAQPYMRYLEPLLAQLRGKDSGE